MKNTRCNRGLQVSKIPLVGLAVIMAMTFFALTGCDNGSGDGGGLPAPTGLSATAISSSDIYLTWNRVNGADGYKVYVSLSYSSGFLLAETTSTNSTNAYNASPNTTYYFKVAAFNGNGEGPMSNVASATTGSGAPTYSINGNWERSEDGMRITISGSTGVITAFGSKPYILDAANKSYIQIGSQKFRNLTSAGNSTWSGQELLFNTNSSQTVCNSTSWSDTTLSLSANGNTLSTYTPGSSDPSATWTRR